MPYTKRRGALVDLRRHATTDMAAQFYNLFVNRRAYTVQSVRPHPETGRHYYYRPKARDGRAAPALNLETLRRHLAGELTIGLYSINPRTQRSKWIAIDADYKNAIEHLLKLQYELTQDGVEPALEKSNRGGHLWIFFDKPALARDCRVYVYQTALRLGLPVKGAGLPEGIEVFPRQDEIGADEFGNAIRAPLGVHRGAKEGRGWRFWFYNADYTLSDQLAYLQRLRKVTEAELSRFVVGKQIPPEFVHHSKRSDEAGECSTSAPGEFRILDYIQVRRRVGRNWIGRCPSCAQTDHDKSGDNLAVAVEEPRKYICWAGCSKEMIRAALGKPIAQTRNV